MWNDNLIHEFLEQFTHNILALPALGLFFQLEHGAIEEAGLAAAASLGFVGAVAENPVAGADDGMHNNEGI